MAPISTHPLFNKIKDYKFYLCSTSPRRLEILNQMGFNPEIKPSNFEENLSKDEFSVQDYVLQTSKGKIDAVWEEMKADPTKYGSNKLLLLASDTVVTNEDEIYEKPKTESENAKVIKRLRDSDHPVEVISAVWLISCDEGFTNVKSESFTEVTEIIMDKAVTDEFIDAYCKTQEGWEVAGGFRIQGSGSLMIKGINGDYFNVVGLPNGKTFKGICKILDCPL
ncbi:unnamed protein product [Ambrosiozyma monospora]|uniref:Unnamed protein product n=1 Tax=Ambrosiozyma monospora TaxID=43982 RepID=A0ACB5SVZ9_AMBMO|nr:unnamed protein product [Ambrosiozyma monospora]